MALVKCPKCGREGVSDKATSCPGCGYNIKKHFKNGAKKEIKNELEERKSVKCPECGAEIDEKSESCPNCGFAIISDNTKSEKVQNCDSSVNPSKKKLKIWIGLGVAVIIGFVFLGGQLYRPNKTTSEQTSKQTSEQTSEQNISEQIGLIEQNIGNMNVGDSDSVTLFGIEGNVVYSNPLSSFNDVTNTATWQPNGDIDIKKIYDKLVEIYGEPDDTDRTTYWRWNEESGLYRVVLQYVNLEIDLVIQRELSTK